MRARKAGAARAVLRRYADFLPVYWREAVTTADFICLVRIRLSKSRIGWLACPRPVVTTVAVKSLGPPITLRSHTTDVSVLGELIVNRDYAPVVAALGTSPLLIVDLGANTGLAARWLLQNYPDATLIAVEPEPGNAEVLRRNLDPYASQVEIVERCAGARRREVKLATGAGEFAFAMHDTSDMVSREGNVEVWTMDDIVSRHPGEAIGLLKCDIEGAEEELFGDCGSWIGRVGAAVVECHAPYTSERLIEDVAKHGISFEIVMNHHNPEYGHDIVIMKRREPAGPSDVPKSEYDQDYEHECR